MSKSVIVFLGAGLDGTNPLDVHFPAWPAWPFVCLFFCSCVVMVLTPVFFGDIRDDVGLIGTGRRAYIVSGILKKLCMYE